MTTRAALAFGLLLAGCSASPKPPASDPRVVVAPGAQVVAPQPPRASINASGFIHVSLGLVNPSGDDAVVEGITDWFDADGHSIGGLLSAPRRLVVPRLGTASLESVAPSSAAVAFQIHIAPGF